MKGIYERGDSFQVKKQYPGREKVTATFKTLKAAEDYVLACDLAYRRGEAFPSPLAPGSSKAASTDTMDKLLDLTTTARWSENRSDTSADNARQFVEFVGRATAVAEGLSMDRILAYVEYRRDLLGNSGKTINKKLSAISVMMDTAFKLKLVPGLIKMPRQKEGKGRLRYYTVEEQRMIFEWLERLGRIEYVDLFQFLVDTGLRPGEAAKLHWNDFRPGRVIVEAPITKTLKTRVVPLTKAAKAAVDRRRSDPQHGMLKGPFAWSSNLATRDIWEKLRERFVWLRGTDTVPYTFRHTCASRLAMAGKQAPMIKDWMGHTSLATTERYMHLGPATLDSLVDALENFQDPTFNERRAA